MFNTDPGSGPESSRAAANIELELGLHAADERDPPNVNGGAEAPPFTTSASGVYGLNAPAIIPRSGLEAADSCGAERVPADLVSVPVWIVVVSIPTPCRSHHTVEP